MDDVTPDLGQLRLDDALKFLAIFRHTNAQPPERRRSLRELCASFGPHTTTVQQLGRLADFFFGPPPRGGGAGLDRLFAEEIAGDGLRPTHAAKDLARQLDVFVSFSRRLRSQFREEKQIGARPVIRLGCIGTLGLRLFAAALSDWRPVSGGANAELHVSIDNSRFLVPQLHAGLLDLVLSYGPADDVVRDNTYDVAFASLGCRSPMVLLANPKAKLWMSDGSDANAGYWDKAFSGADVAARKRKRPQLEAFRSVRFEQVDFQRTPLVVVPSWKQPKPLDDLIKAALQEGAPVRIADSYDEALALAQLDRGVAVATDLYSKRDGLTAFRLAPEGSYERWVGVYYNTREGLSPYACRIAEFLRGYLTEHMSLIQDGEAPALGDKGFEKWCKELMSKKEWAARDWAEFAAKHYPTQP